MTGAVLVTVRCERRELRRLTGTRLGPGCDDVKKLATEGGADRERTQQLRFTSSFRSSLRTMWAQDGVATATRHRPDGQD
jgi:hypothetical protein